jgi:hypoxanthine phosphoribosyltransferase
MNIKKLWLEFCTLYMGREDAGKKKNNQSILTHPTYDQIHEGCVNLAEPIIASGNKPDMIVGLVRGGMLPAVILSNLLEIPMTAVHYSSASGAGDGKNHSNEIPVIQAKNILIVDDICDTGHTLQEVFGELTRRKQFCRSAVLYYKEDMGGHSPEFYWQSIPKDSPWIIFPFEGTSNDSTSN